jgi:hypothetical protein
MKSLGQKRLARLARQGLIAEQGDVLERPRASCDWGDGWVLAIPAPTPSERWLLAVQGCTCEQPHHTLSEAEECAQRVRQRTAN